MSTIRERVIEVLEFKDLKSRDLEAATGIDRYRWDNFRNKGQKTTEEHLAGLEKVVPEFIYWIVTGNELPEAGQISPMTEKARRDSKTA
ncbi:MAG: DNA-binding protein [Candidatus Pacearchaeota archaeon]|nr:DNA-binding protein [Candidatus Pacearchaeota archaeon]